MTVATVDHRELLVDGVERMLRDHAGADAVAAHEGALLADLWAQLEAAGLPLAAVPEHAGGGAATLGDVLALVRACGRHAAPVPLAETALLAAPLLAAAGLDAADLPAVGQGSATLALAPPGVGQGPATLALAPPGVAGPRLRRDGADWRLTGGVARVPWARHAALLAVVADGPNGPLVAALAPDAAVIAPGENLAAEPRDGVHFDDVRLPARSVAAGVDRDGLWALGALGRAASMCGALDRILALTLEYAGQRHQFGRPLVRFQAIQQQLALAAAEVAVADAALGLAVEALDAGAGGAALLRATAIAKCRVGEAAGPVAEIAHQVHGAIGITREHQLQLFTRRLLAWRDEYGSERDWAVRLGRMTLARGAGGLWPDLVGSATTTEEPPDA